MSESVKQVILRDPKTNEILIPKIIGTLGYEPAEDGTLVPPYTNDADTLGGKTADQFASADHNHDDAYAAKTHTHDYAASNHTHIEYARAETVTKLSSDMSAINASIDIGDIVLSIAEKSPDLYHLCDGSPIDATKYPVLADLIGLSANLTDITDTDYTSTYYNNLSLCGMLENGDILATYYYSSDSAVAWRFLYSTDGGVNWTLAPFNIKTEGSWYANFNGFAYLGGYIYATTSGGWTNHAEGKIIRINPNYSTYTALWQGTNTLNVGDMYPISGNGSKFIVCPVNNHTFYNNNYSRYFVISEANPTTATLVETTYVSSGGYVYFYFDESVNKFARVRQNGTIEYVSNLTTVNAESTVTLPLTNIPAGIGKFINIGTSLYYISNTDVHVITNYTTDTTLFNIPNSPNTVSLFVVDSNLFIAAGYSDSTHSLYKLENGSVVNIYLKRTGTIPYNIFNHNNRSASINIKGQAQVEKIGCCYPAITHPNASYYIKQK